MAAETYRENPRFDIETAIREVGVGEAVTSFLQRKGVPGIVERTLIRPPASQLGPISAQERRAVLARSGRCRASTTRRSTASRAFEILTARAAEAASAAEAAERDEAEAEAAEREYKAARRYSGTRVSRSTSGRVKDSDSFGEAMAEVVIKELKGTTGRRIVRGILGGLFKGR